MESITKRAASEDVPIKDTEHLIQADEVYEPITPAAATTRRTRIVLPQAAGPRSKGLLWTPKTFAEWQAEQGEKGYQKYPSSDNFQKLITEINKDYENVHIEL